VGRRVGHPQFFLLYLITGLCGGVVFVLSYLLATGEPGHLSGASGAIAGIMGIFTVRCYFKSMTVLIPSVWPMSFKLTLNSLVIIGLFFLRDLPGGEREKVPRQANFSGFAPPTPTAGRSCLPWNARSIPGIEAGGDTPHAPLDHACQRKPEPCVLKFKT